MGLTMIALPRWKPQEKTQGKTWKYQAFPQGKIRGIWIFPGENPGENLESVHTQGKTQGETQGKT